MSKARDLANAGTALTTVSATELGYLDGVTSNVQTQINAKQAVVSGVDSTEIGYLDGVTSAIQTQIDGKIGQSTAINPTIVDAKGDLIAATAADTVARLAVGTNGQVLTADSAEATGVKWASPSSGGMTLLSTTSLTGSSVTVSSINQTYKNLQILIRGVTCSGTNTNGYYLQLNGSGSIVSSAGLNTGSITTITRGTITLGDPNGNSGLGNTYQAEMVLDIYNYSNTSSYKPFHAVAGWVQSNDFPRAYIFSGYAETNSAITSLTFSPSTTNFSSGQILIYGVS